MQTLVTNAPNLPVDWLYVCLSVGKFFKRIGGLSPTNNLSTLLTISWRHQLTTLACLPVCSPSFGLHLPHRVPTNLECPLSIRLGASDQLEIILVWVSGGPDLSTTTVSFHELDGKSKQLEESETTSLDSDRILVVNLKTMIRRVVRQLRKLRCYHLLNYSTRCSLHKPSKQTNHRRNVWDERQQENEKRNQLSTSFRPLTQEPWRPNVIRWGYSDCWLFD